MIVLFSVLSLELSTGSGFLSIHSFLDSSTTVVHEATLFLSNPTIIDYRAIDTQTIYIWIMCTFKYIYILASGLLLFIIIIRNEILEFVPSVIKMKESDFDIFVVYE